MRIFITVTMRVGGTTPNGTRPPGWQQNYDYSIEFPRHKKHHSLDQRFRHSSQILLGVYYKDLNEDSLEKAFKDGGVRRQLSSQLQVRNSAIYLSKVNSLDGPWGLEYGLRLKERKSQYKNELGVNLSPIGTLFGG